MTDFICKKCSFLEFNRDVSDAKLIVHENRERNCTGPCIEAHEAIAFCESTNAEALRGHIATISTMSQRLSRQLQATNFASIAAGVSPGHIDLRQIRERTTQLPSDWIARTFRLDNELAQRLATIMERSNVSLAAAYRIDFHEQRASRLDKLREVNETLSKLQSRLRLKNRLDKATSKYLQIIKVRDAKPEHGQCLTNHSHHYTPYQLRAIDELKEMFENSDNCGTFALCVNCGLEVEINPIDFNSMTPHDTTNTTCGFSNEDLTTCDLGTLIMGAKQYEYLIVDDLSPETSESVSSS